MKKVITYLKMIKDSIKGLKSNIPTKKKYIFAGVSIPVAISFYFIVKHMDYDVVKQAKGLMDYATELITSLALCATLAIIYKQSRKIHTLIDMNKRLKFEKQYTQVIDPNVIYTANLINRKSEGLYDAKAQRLANMKEMFDLLNDIMEKSNASIKKAMEDII